MYFTYKWVFYKKKRYLGKVVFASYTNVGKCSKMIMKIIRKKKDKKTFNVITW